MKLAFGILASHESPATLAQLVDALGPDALVVIHHDATKGTALHLRRDNVRFVDDPVRTGWGEWSLCEAILRILRTAGTDRSWGYFQLLSASCLPIRPIRAFEEFISEADADVNMDLVALDEDPIALMSHGFRGYAPAGTLGHRVLRRLRRWYMVRQRTSLHRYGLNLGMPAAGQTRTVRARLARSGMRFAIATGRPGLDHPFDANLRCFVGSTWWGGRREACEYIVSQPEDGPLQRYFKRVLIPDEFYFQTLLGNSAFRIARSNHLVSRFDDAHPVRFGVDDLPKLAASKRFFARKFPDNAAAPVRLELLGDIAGPPTLPMQQHSRVT